MTLPAFAAERGRLQSIDSRYAAPVAINRYLLPAPALCSKPAARRCCCRSTPQTDRRRETDEQTDGRTDTRSLHRPPQSDRSLSQSLAVVCHLAPQIRSHDFLRCINLYICMYMYVCFSLTFEASKTLIIDRTKTNLTSRRALHDIAASCYNVLGNPPRISWLY